MMNKLIQKITILILAPISLNYSMDKPIDERSRDEQSVLNTTLEDTITYCTNTRMLPRKKSTPEDFKVFFHTLIRTPCFNRDAAHALDINMLYEGLKKNTNNNVCKRIVALFENYSYKNYFYTIITSKPACFIYGMAMISSLWYLHSR